MKKTYFLLLSFLVFYAILIPNIPKSINLSQEDITEIRKDLSYEINFKEKGDGKIEMTKVLFKFTDKPIMAIFKKNLGQKNEYFFISKDRLFKF